VRVKRYVAENLQEAMVKVKMEMGKEAIILHTRKFKEGGFFGFFGKVMFEVTAAVEVSVQKTVPQPNGPQQLETPQKNQNTEANFDKQEGTTELKEEIQEMKSMISEMISQMDATQDTKVLPKPFQKYHQILIDNEVDDKLSKKILKDIMKQMPQGKTIDNEFVQKSLEQQILKLLRKPKPISFKRQGLNQQSIALVGPTGVGKTTTIAKLAATFSIVDKKSVALITADTYRVAAVEQLKTYGEIIGITVDVVYTPGELQEAVSKHTDKDLILIDTAGRSHKNSEQMSELKNFLDVSEPTDIFLVLSATTRYQDMIEIANSYSDIPVSRMIFTKLDETSTFGAILNIISKTQKCLSYVTVGQNVPEDIEIADPIKIAKMITRER
jgi:flagellar biosynthesis protein FlhF